MEKNAYKYLLFGLLGGIAMFSLDLNNIYDSTHGGFYFLFSSSTVLLPLLLYRARHKMDSSFRMLLSMGIIVSIIALTFYVITSQLYKNVIVSDEQRTHLVDEKVNRLIMEFKGNKIDIFALEDEANEAFFDSFSDTATEAALLFPLYLLYCVFFALILKSKVVA